MAESADLAARLVESRTTGGCCSARNRTSSPPFTSCAAPRLPGVLFEAGYISNVDDEALLLTPEGRAPIVAALARAIEVDVAQDCRVSRADSR